MSPDEAPDADAQARSTALAEAAHLAILALINSEEIHPHVIYVLARRMYKQPDSLLFDLSQYSVKQVYDRGMFPAEGSEDVEPTLPFAQDALAALARWRRRTQHLPLIRTLEHLFEEEPLPSAA